MYPLHHYGWSDLRALRSGRYKVIDAPRPELYDVDRDPNESHEPLRRAAGARRSHDRAAARRWRAGFTKTAAAHAGRRRRSRSARAARGARLRRLVRRHRLGPAHRARRSQGQDRPVQQAGHRDRPVQGTRAGDAEPSFAQVIALLNEVLARGSRRSSTPGSCSGTQYLAHGEPEKAVEHFKQTLKLEAGLRPRRVQPRAGVPPDGRRRGGAGGVRALPDARSEGPVRPLPDGRDLARSRRSAARRGAVPPGARDRSHTSPRRRTRSASSRSSGAIRRRPSG